MTTRWRIEGELTLDQAPSLKAGLAKALEGEGPLEVDLSGVTTVDAAGRGLLRLARRLAERHGRTLTYRRALPEIRFDAFSPLPQVAAGDDPWAQHA